MNFFKKFVLNLGFVKKEINSSMDAFVKFREETYRKAFNDARKDLEETNVYDVEKKSEEKANKMLSDMFSPVDMNHVFSLERVGNGAKIKIGGRYLEENEIMNLKSEAEMLIQTNLYKVICETPKDFAQKAMFISGETLVDMQKGRSILYMLSVQKHIINTLMSLGKK